MRLHRQPRRPPRPGAAVERPSPGPKPRLAAGRRRPREPRAARARRQVRAPVADDRRRARRARPRARRTAYQVAIACRSIATRSRRRSRSQRHSRTLRGVVRSPPGDRRRRAARWASERTSTQHRAGLARQRPRSRPGSTPLEAAGRVASLRAGRRRSCAVPDRQPRVPCPRPMDPGDRSRGKRAPTATATATPSNGHERRGRRRPRPGRRQPAGRRRRRSGRHGRRP